MNTSRIAFNNLKKNFSFYTLYLCSVSFVITIFFTFTSFSMNEIILQKISTDGRVELMCHSISIFLMVFVIFYMFYSNRFFLRRRTKELGIYTLLGYRKFTVLFLLTIENIIICGGAFVIGLIFGAVLHKGIIYGIIDLLKLSIDGSSIPLFNVNAITKTAVFILFVVLVLTISNGKFLIQTSLMDMVRFDKSAEKKMNFRKFPAFMGLFMIALGYVIAIDILRGPKSLWIKVGFSPIGMLTMILVVLGTFLFITSFLPYVMQISKKNKKAFYTEDKIITTPNFIYRIRSNSRTLIMLTLLSAATLTISNVMSLTLYYPIAAVSRIAPSELEFRIEDASQVDKVKKLIQQYTSKEDNVSYIQTDLYKVTSKGKQLPIEYGIGTAKGDADNEKLLRKKGFECMSFNNYKALLQAQGREGAIKQLSRLRDNEAILVKYQPNSDATNEVGKVYPLIVHNNTISLTVKNTTLNNPISFANSVGTLIVKDDVYDVIKSSNLPKTSILSINGTGIKNNEDLYHKIDKLLKGSPYLQGHSHRINDLFWTNSSTFLLIGFLVVLFFIATGSILYFNNVSAISDSKEDYEILRKMGYTDNIIRKIIRKQVATFFCVPFLLGLLDSLFATLVYKVGLMQNLLGNSFAQYVPVVISLSITAGIYLLYYFLTIHTCSKNVLGK
ncbi:FtsX-like permease family protein [Anaeromicropila herbilytica]|uniref:ABC transporter permease n=1 Tax=Anaeromicropila herbilytica TaxID=2785025 RepID=A0A7R7EL48_9FIRM|nr:FtsX-like permease family protein [Anaeromicropila herbilytica]BCN30764.1 ABC transporter permease [Anaeromicropila herbilytica]